MFQVRIHPDATFKVHPHFTQSKYIRLVILDMFVSPQLLLIVMLQGSKVPWQHLIPHAFLNIFNHFQTRFNCCDAFLDDRAFKCCTN